VSGARDVAFLCLGVMGFPMAGHLAAAGHRVAVWNRTGARARDFVDRHGGRAAASPCEAAAGAEVVFVCSGDDDDLRAVLYGGEGALEGMAAGARLVDHTTVSAALARELDAACRERGLGFLDAPISGGQAGALNGQLTVMIGGTPEDHAAVAPLIDVYAKKQVLMGPAGSGQLTKMVNQICIAGLVQALAEGLHFARVQGLDVHRVVEVVSQGAAQSWQMDHRAATMIEGRFDFGFAVDWMRKDLGIALSEGRTRGAPLPVTALVDQLYAALQQRGDGRLDTSSLIRLLEGPPGGPIE